MGQVSSINVYLFICQGMQFYIVHVLMYTFKYKVFLYVRMPFQHSGGGEFVRYCMLLSFKVSCYRIVPMYLQLGMDVIFPQKCGFPWILWKSKGHSCAELRQIWSPLFFLPITSLIYTVTYINRKMSHWFFQF